MIKKPKITLTQDQIRERTERAGMRPYIADIIDLDTHVHVYYLVFAEKPYLAIDLARQYGDHAPGSAGQAISIDTAFVAHTVGQVGRLLCQDVDAPCIVSTAEPDSVETRSATIAQRTIANGNLESRTVFRESQEGSPDDPSNYFFPVGG